MNMTAEKPQNKVQKRISFYCHPYNFEKSEHTVEKDSSAGVKGRYLKGIASGSKIDGTGERITEKAVKSMQSQAMKGDILLYADRHNVMHSNDIGKMVSQQILPNGDWLVEFKLYEPSDGMGANTDETVNKIWKQLKGLPPYTKPRQRGFSIEGFIPDNGILQMDSDGGSRIIDDVQLDGVVLVTRPAYETSIASAIYKALEEIPPWQVRKNITSSLTDALYLEEQQDNFYRQRYRIQDALEREIEKAMTAGADRNTLGILFQEYAGLMIDLLLNNVDYFNNESKTESVDEVETLYNVSSIGNDKGTSPVLKNKVLIYKSLLTQLDALEKQLN